MAIYGGFEGGKSRLDDRDWKNNETILSGDLDSNDVEVAHPRDLLTEPTRSENSYHVVMARKTNEAAVLDGFTITHGRADGEDIDNLGGGMLIEGTASPTIINCVFVLNTASQGGGMHCSGYAIPALSDCTFTKNAAAYAGAIKATNCDMMIKGCSFINNFAAVDGGAGILGKTTSTGCIFTGNSAGYDGGAIGTGSRLQVQTGNADLDRKIEDEFAAWELVCNAGGKMTFADILRLTAWTSPKDSSLELLSSLIEPHAQ